MDGMRLPGLRWARAEKHLTQQKLAEQAKVSVRTVGTLENGRSGARAPTVERLAQALGVSRARLLGEEGQRDG